MDGDHPDITSNERIFSLLFRTINRAILVAVVSETHVRSSNRCLGGGVKVRRGRREFRVAAVATEVSSVEEVS